MIKRKHNDDRADIHDHKNYKGAASASPADLWHLFFYCFLVYSCSGGTPAFPVTSAILPDYSQNRSSSVLSSALHIAMHRFIDGL